MATYCFLGKQLDKTKFSYEGAQLGWGMDKMTWASPSEAMLLLSVSALLRSLTARSAQSPLLNLNEYNHDLPAFTFQ